MFYSVRSLAVLPVNNMPWLALREAPICPRVPRVSHVSPDIYCNTSGSFVWKRQLGYP